MRMDGRQRQRLRPRLAEVGVEGASIVERGLYCLFFRATCRGLFGLRITAVWVMVARDVVVRVD